MQYRPHFDPELSYKLDAVVTLLDMRIPRVVRWILRLYKRWLERGIQ
jgi:hypothetical protein